ncbi:cyclin-D1-binding protein 1 homolog [Aplysia californica]|uniref:Cyclin-D1-binding protein 1 homolog n=1 Tax=Aplysia californica TaxID=6500 RepID=A0ABM0K3A7_APLCA|nr:cyclin-D1-binding protein 1 homolog [Aplysia californica]
MAGNVSDEQENVFKNLEDNISLVSKQIRDGESKREENAEFDKEAYWIRIGAIFKVLSVETTKMSLAFSKRPFPSHKNTQQMAQELEKGMLTLVSAYYSLPVAQGASLRRHLQAAVLQVLDSLAGFVSALSSCLQPDDKHSGRLQWTGGVWEAAGFILLKDNRECALKSLKDTSELVEDAFGEIEQATENDGQAEDFMGEDDGVITNDAVWSEQDKEVVKACTGLVKATKTILKKSKESVRKHSTVDSPEGVRVLDELVDFVRDVSRSVDDFVCGIYAPINYASLKQNGKVLSQLNGQILKFLRDSSLTVAEDEKWLDFLSQANTHNLNKLTQSTLPQSEEG